MMSKGDRNNMKYYENCSATGWERFGPNQQVCAQTPEVNDHYQQGPVALKEQA